MASNGSELQKNSELQHIVSALCHDLSAPIRHIREFVNLLISSFEHDLTPEQQDYRDFITGGVKDIEKKLDGLLVYSRLGTQPTHKVATDFSRLFQNAYRNVTDEMQEIPPLGINIIGDWPILTVSPQHITDVFYHLLQNAIEHRRPDIELVIDVIIEQHEQAWQFTINDNGQGVETKNVDYLTQLFTTSGNQRGKVGIGLPIVKRIIADLHAGSFTINTTQLGFSASFTLPDIELTLPDKNGV